MIMAFNCQMQATPGHAFERASVLILNFNLQCQPPLPLLILADKCLSVATEMRQCEAVVAFADKNMKSMIKGEVRKAAQMKQRSLKGASQDRSRLVITIYGLDLNGKDRKPILLDISLWLSGRRRLLPVPCYPSLSLSQPLSRVKSLSLHRANRHPTTLSDAEKRLQHVGIALEALESCIGEFRQATLTIENLARDHMQ